LKDAEARIVRDEFGFSQNDLTFDALIDKFLEYQETHNRASTTRRYKAVADHVRKYLAQHRPDVIFVSQLSSEVMDGYKSYRRSEWINPNGQPVESDADVAVHTRKGARARTVNLGCCQGYAQSGYEMGLYPGEPAKVGEAAEGGGSKTGQVFDQRGMSAVSGSNVSGTVPSLL
jgi:hypothetical protein